MGADGGTIPKRIELVKNKKRKEKVDRDMENVAKWKMCALSQDPLKEPIVACELGRLYNKEAVIQALIDKTITESENAKHIRSLKDVKVLNLTPNPEYDGAKAGKGDGGYTDYNIAQFICPVIGVEMNGNHKFVLVWNCGCVVSEKAIKEVKSTNCHKCFVPFDAADPEALVTLNPSTEDAALYQNRMDERREKHRLSKKQKKQAAKSSGEATAADPNLPSTSSTDASKPGPSGIGNKRKKAMTGETTTSTVADSSGVRALAAKSVQADPTATKVFKSLFTSCDEAKKREKEKKPNWVTYDPQYY